jgi:hypothetical protein
MKQLVSFSPQMSIQLDAEIHRDAQQRLKIVFELRGPTSQIYLPETALAPQRRDELWKRTCFEVFFAPEGRKNYWEINLSATSDWNVYSFESYRDGMKTEPKIAAFRIDQKKTDQTFRLEATTDLSHLNLGTTPLKISATAVIETQDGQISYWAFQHCGKNPDFHLLKSFVARV